MTTRFLLHTNVLSQPIRNPRGTVGTRFEQSATLVTDNVAEFPRVAGLHIENWVLP